MDSSKRDFQELLQKYRLLQKKHYRYNQMQAILNKTKLLYIDETGWKKDGLPYWLWCFCNSVIAYYHIDKSRGSKVIKSILGDKYSGIMISDFLVAYKKIESRKQKCLPHLLCIIDRLQPSCHVKSCYLKNCHTNEKTYLWQQKR